MHFTHSFKNRLAGAVAAITISFLLISPSVFAAGPIIGWGEIAFDGGALDGSDFAAIAALCGHRGRRRSLSCLEAGWLDCWLGQERSRSDYTSGG